MDGAAAARCALALAAATLLASPPAPASTVDTALAARTLAGAHVGVLAVDANSRTVLYARNADDDFTPASTLKLVVGSAALARLGPSFVFLTTVETGGAIANGTLQGDLYLRGGGDPELSLRDLDAAAATVFAAGVRRITGALVGDASRYDAPRYPLGWTVDDIPYGYAAVPSALSFDLNAAHVRLLPGVAGAPAIVQEQPQTDAFTLENATVTGIRGSADTTDVARPFNLPQTIRVVGSFPLDAPLSDDLEPAVPDPPRYALDVFRQSLEAHGITVDGGMRLAVTPPSATLLWSHPSKPLRLLLRDFWPPSINLIGEQLLQELGSGPHSGTAEAAAPQVDTRDRGIVEELAWLRSIGVDPKALTITDGSGLSEYDRITPRALVTILLADWAGPERETVVAALPVAGISGTLQTTFAQAPLKGNVFAKTGSMNHARLLAGYLRTIHGRTIAFALMVNDWMDASPQAQSALDAARAAALGAIARL